jgi:hypothetical protein
MRLLQIRFTIWKAFLIRWIKGSNNMSRPWSISWRVTSLSLPFVTSSFLPSVRVNVANFTHTPPPPQSFFFRPSPQLFQITLEESIGSLPDWRPTAPAPGLATSVGPGPGDSWFTDPVCCK